MIQAAPETAMQACLRKMREKIAVIEGCGNPGIQRQAMDLRHQMIELVSLVNGLEGDIAAARMVGRAEPLKAQRPVDELPIFTLVTKPEGHALSVAEIEAMEAFRHREGDHTQDREELAA